MAKDMIEEVKEEEAEAREPGEGDKEKADEKKRGGHHKRASGGKLPLDGADEFKTSVIKRKAGGLVRGGETKMRPDRRARGGATSDLHPETAAGNMSKPSYLSK